MEFKYLPGYGIKVLLMFKKMAGSVSEQISFNSEPSTSEEEFSAFF